VTVSLDSLDGEVFRAMTDSDTPVAQVLTGIETAARAGLAPLKVNAVVRRGVNDHTVVDLARHFKGTGHVVRFIEYMDVGMTNRWQPSDVVSGREIIDRIDRVFPLEPVSATYRGEVARRYRYRDGSGEVGVITSVTQPFCGDCSRARLSSEGKLFTCLFASHGTDLRALIRGGASDSEVSRTIERVWSARQDRYSEERAASAERVERVEMHYIGG
jgi:cyclic pyranopterin phosphate synthase